jgi:hypothetical protein
MRRVLSALLPLPLPLLVLAGCDAGPPAVGPEAPPGTVATGTDLRAWFPPRGLVDTIEVDAVQRLPLQAAELVGPDGAVTAANSLNSTATPSGAAGQWEAGHPYDATVAPGTSSLMAVAGPPGPAATAVFGQRQLLASLSTADILLPDPVAYRRDWQHYRIRLTFGTLPGPAETQEIAAPEPPPAR